MGEAGHAVNLSPYRQAGGGFEYGPPVPLGIAATSIAMSDEHMAVAMVGTPPPLGTKVDFIPGRSGRLSICTPRVWVSGGVEILDCWPVSARGASQ